VHAPPTRAKPRRRTGEAGSPVLTFDPSTCWWTRLPVLARSRTARTAEGADSLNGGATDTAWVALKCWEGDRALCADAATGTATPAAVQVVTEPVVAAVARESSLCLPLVCGVVVVAHLHARAAASTG
jgi:hypothetical protein